MKKPNDPQIIASVDKYWDSVRGLPAIEALYATAVHAWMHARHRCTDDPQLTLMLLRPAAYLALRREGVTVEQAQAQLVNTMMQLDRLATAQEQQRLAPRNEHRPMRRTRWNDDSNVIAFPPPKQKKPAK